MSQQLNVSTETSTAELPLRLFVVTLDWNDSNSEEGDYSDKVWAHNHQDAVQQLAEQMANHSDSGCETEAEMAEYAANVVASASSHAAMLVAPNVLSDCRELLAGPGNVMSAEAKADFDILSAIMKKYGAE